MSELKDLTKYGQSHIVKSRFQIEAHADKISIGKRTWIYLLPKAGLMVFVCPIALLDKRKIIESQCTR